VSFTEPVSSTKNATAGSLSRKKVAPASTLLARAAALTSLRGPESSPANKATGFAKTTSLVTVAGYQRLPGVTAGPQPSFTGTQPPFAESLGNTAVSSRNLT
jgi:hypothetical protein